MSGQVRNDARSGGALLRIENGNFAYKSGPQILKDINIEVGPGEILAVLGPNGAGKTTLLRCMMDMLHWQSGRSLLDGEDIRSIPASKLWRRMAYVPQARSAAVSYTAFQTVLLGRSSRIGAFSAPSAEDMKVAESVMERLGISHLADKPCYAISGGELQMVLIARAMAAEPEILVLDEPESNLDFKNQLIVLDAMTALAAEGVACIFNTHYPAHALQRAGKALMLSKDGRSIFGDTTGVVTEENIRHAFGVDALIGEVETPQSIMKNVVAVGISEGGHRGAERRAAQQDFRRQDERRDDTRFHNRDHAEQREGSPHKQRVQGLQPPPHRQDGTASQEVRKIYNKRDAGGSGSGDRSAVAQTRPHTGHQR